MRRREPIMASCKELLTGFYETFKKRKVGKMDNVQLNIMYKKRRKKTVNFSTFIKNGVGSEFVSLL